MVITSLISISCNSGEISNTSNPKELIIEKQNLETKTMREPDDVKKGARAHSAFQWWLLC